MRTSKTLFEIEIGMPQRKGYLLLKKTSARHKPNIHYNNKDKFRNYVSFTKITHFGQERIYGIYNPNFFF